MPVQTFEAFSRLVRSGDIPRAVYLHGEEDQLKDEVVRAILDKVVDPGVRDFNYDQRSAAQLDPDSVESLCNTLPMMADRRLVVIRDVEAWNKRARARGAVLRYLEKPAAETVLVLVQGAARRDEERGANDPDADLVRLTCAVAVDRYGPALARKWLERRAAGRGLALEPAAAEHLMQVLEGDLLAAASELDKLAGLADSAPITLEQVTALLGVPHGETQADWCEAVLQDEPGRAATILPHLLAQPGVSGVGLLTLLGANLIGVGLARAQYDRGLRGGALVRAVGDALFKARPPVRLDWKRSPARWAAVVERWPVARVDAAVAAALQADRRLKETTLSDERGVLLDLVMRLLPLAREAA
jgi:DNA polymerase-3 subunit delta